MLMMTSQHSIGLPSLRATTLTVQSQLCNVPALQRLSTAYLDWRLPVVLPTLSGSSARPAAL
eukprot:5346014-Amphidinium_carterae.1